MSKSDHQISPLQTSKKRSAALAVAGASALSHNQPLHNPIGEGRFVLKSPFTVAKSEVGEVEEAVPKNFALCLICWIATLQFGMTGASAQSEPAPADAQFAAAPQPAMTPDDAHLLLMIRNAVIALNQANLTGNYSVLRDLGTPNFQMSNNSARLAESFTALRSRRIDVSPVMFFNPKFTAPPSILDGQVLRVTGFFPTTPEQVNFDLAFQLSGEQWMLAAIAVSVTPPGEDVQAIVAPAFPSFRSAEAGDTKPIRIDLSQPSTATQPGAPKKAAPKKPKPPAQKTAAAQPGASPAPGAVPEQQPAPPAQAPQPPRPPSPGSPEWNPFGR